MPSGSGSTRPCCDRCCTNPPQHLRLRAVTAGCNAIPIGFTICLTLAPARNCDATPCDSEEGVIRYVWTGFICGILSSTELLCCRKGCLKSCWQLGGPGRTIIFSPDPPRDDWNCEPFFMHFDNVQWQGTAPCFNGGLGVPFSVEIDELACVEDTSSSCGSSGSGGGSGSGSVGPGGG